MNTESSEHLMVDTKDIECIICYSRYAHVTNEAMIISCGHTLCSSCLKNIKECPFCKTEILQNPTKNVLLSSLLERDSQVNKCGIHKRPIELYSKEEKKMFCSQCLVEKYQDKYESIQKIESKIKEIKNTEGKIHSKKEENKKEILEKLNQGNLNLKRKLDDLYEEKLAYDLANKKKLRKMIDAFTFTEKDLYEHQILAQGLSKFEENAKGLQESWKNNQEGVTAEQILSASLGTKQATQFYNEKAKQMAKSLTEKEKGLEKIILEPKNNLCESSKCLFERISEKFLKLNPEMKLDPKYRPQIARNYLMSTLEEHGIFANYQEKDDYIELNSSTSEKILKNFYPQFFDCCIEKLHFSCSSISDLNFITLCEILQNIQALLSLSISLKEPTSKQIELISSLALKSRTIQKFSCNMPIKAEIQNDLKECIISLLESKRTSGFHLGFSLENNISIDFQQDLVQSTQQTTKNLQEFSAEFLGENPLIHQLLQTISPFVSNFSSLRKLKLSFGSTIWYDLFLNDLCPVLRQFQSLQELDLGFAKVDLLTNFDLGQQIGELIIHSNQLKKVNLFLAGNELSDYLFFDLFHIDEVEPSAEHRLEEFSLTLMRCEDLDIEDIIKYASNFPNLKKLVLKINRCDIEFGQIAEFLKEAAGLKSLSYLELAIRDFGTLETDEKRDLEVCKCRLSQYNIQHKIVFEELMSYHLPGFVSIDSEDEGDGEQVGEDEVSETENEEDEEENEEEDESEERVEETQAANGESRCV